MLLVFKIIVLYATCTGRSCAARAAQRHPSAARSQGAVTAGCTRAAALRHQPPARAALKLRVKRGPRPGHTSLTVSRAIYMSRVPAPLNRRVVELNWPVKFIVIFKSFLLRVGQSLIYGVSCNSRSLGALLLLLYYTLFTPRIQSYVCALLLLGCH